MVRRKYMLTKSYICFAAILLSTILFVLAGCSGTSTSQNGQGAVSAKLVWNNNKAVAKSVASAPVGVATVRLAISGAGITTIQQDFPAADGKGVLSGVHSGSGLTVAASGLDSSGTVIYQGAVSNVTVQNGATTDVGTIVMTPASAPAGVFTSAMLTGKTFIYFDNDPLAVGSQDIAIGMLFSSTGDYYILGTKIGTWSINSSGQLVMVKTINGHVDAHTLTSTSGSVISTSDTYTGTTTRVFSATFTETELSPATLIGTWGGYGTPKISFVDSTHYLIVSAENAVPESGVFTGLEYGTYTWDSVTGVGTLATQIFDTNGTGGASGSSSTVQFSFHGDSLTVGGPTDGYMQFPRLKSSATNPYVGSWWSAFPDAIPGNAGGVLIAFIDDTHCLLAQAENSPTSGIELGTYTIDASNVLHTVLTVDTNGDSGFQSILNHNHIYTVSVSGTILTIAEPTAQLPEDRPPKDLIRLQ
jgi:hypothetical protein